jgi:hypothetical protein
MIPRTANRRPGIYFIRTDAESFLSAHIIYPTDKTPRQTVPDQLTHHIIQEMTNLVLILISLLVDDVVEAELVDALGGGNDAEPVTELLLLEELLGPVELCVSTCSPLNMQ